MLNQEVNLQLRFVAEIKKTDVLNVSIHLVSMLFLLLSDCKDTLFLPNLQEKVTLFLPNFIQKTTLFLPNIYHYDIKTVGYKADLGLLSRIHEPLSASDRQLTGCLEVRYFMLFLHTPESRL